MTQIGRELPRAALRDSAYALAVSFYGRKCDKVFLLLRAPPKEIAVTMILIRPPAEPEGSLSPHALRFPPVLFTGETVSTDTGMLSGWEPRII